VIETHKSFCRFCHVFCGVEVDVEDGRVVAVRGDKDNAVTRGYTCPKGRAEVERIYHPDRVLAPLERTPEGFVEVTPSAALDGVAERLGAIVAEHGPGSVAVYCGCGAHRTSTGGPWFVRKWLDALGSPGLYTSMTIDSPSLFLSFHRLFGGPVPVNIFDIARAEVAMFVGTNPVASHLTTMPQSSPTRALNEAQKRGMKLIVVDPRRSDCARRADIHLQVRPGEDASLLAGMIKIIIEDELYDSAYVDECVSGVAALGEAVADFDLDYVSARTGVPAASIREAAEVFAKAGTGGAQSGVGLHMARHQSLCTQLVMTLNALCGRYDRPGGLGRNLGVLSPAFPEGMGPAPLPHFTGPTSRIRGIQGTFSLIGFCGEMPTNTLTDEILTPGEGQIRALIVNGGNPALVFPDAPSTQRALEELDLLVVCDLFLSETAQHADYVLPVKHPFERTDVPRLMDGNYPVPFSQYAAPLVDAPPGALEEWEVFWELADRLGIDMNWGGSLMERKPTADELLDRIHAHSRIPLDEVRRYPGGHVWGEPELAAGGMIPNMLGHPDGKMAAGHPEILEELRAVRAEPIGPTAGYAAGDEFAFRLITYRLKEVYGTQGRNLPSLAAKRPYNPLLMHPDAMRDLGIGEGDEVEIRSGHGATQGIVASSDELAADVVALAYGWGDPTGKRGVREVGTCVQLLIDDDRDYDPITGLAQQSAVPVNVRSLARG
jgi:anaerobic selenocysteine-containing dehydrogenase